MLRLSRWICQRNVFDLIFALVEEHVAPLFCSVYLQLFPAAWASSGPMLSLSVLDVYGTNTILLMKLKKSLKSTYVY